MIRKKKKGRLQVTLLLKYSRSQISSKRETARSPEEKQQEVQGIGEIEQVATMQS